MATESRIALVTGANKGIGLEIARALGRDGIIVLLGCRDPARGKAAAAELAWESIDARVLAIDVTDEASIRAAANHIEREFGRLDILVNNAGIALGLDSGEEIGIELMRQVYETNVFGVLAVSQAMLPLLRRAPAGRIVNLSSTLGSLGLTSDPETHQGKTRYLAYSSSKSALNGVTVQLANALRDTPIKVNAACPGHCATDLNDHSGPRSPAQGAVAPARLAVLGSDGPTGGFFNDAGLVPW